MLNVALAYPGVFFLSLTFGDGINNQAIRLTLCPVSSKLIARFFLPLSVVRAAATTG